MTSWGWTWTLITIAVLSVEFFAIFSPVRGDTLSENVWVLVRRSRAWSAIVVGLLTWLMWHFIVEPRFFPQWHGPHPLDDLILVAAALFIGFRLGPIPYAGRSPRS